ncbi:MAG: NTP transferase domain-containing protein [Actinobacteria bacterium]|nr:NTP transferase domain-containing protein [Actinomycetota bacterium]
MKAVVMAGGEGTRLRPLTSNQPKPMVPIVGKPCMEHILELLRDHGFEDVVVTVAFLPQAIRSYFGDGENLGINVQYSVEESPLGTAGSVRLASDVLDETFLVISGDALCDIDLGKIVEFHKEKGAAVTIGMKSVENPLEFGIVVTDEDGRVERFLEKPSWGQVFSDTINTGIYVLEPEVLRHIPTDRPYDFSKELFPLLLEMGRPIYGYVCEGYWQDIGNLDQYRQANFDALDEKVRLNVGGMKIRGDVWVGEGVEIDDVEGVEGPAFIGNYCTISPESSVGPYSVLGPGTTLRERGRVSRSVIDSSCYIGRNAVIEGAILGRNCDVRSRARVHEGVAIGDQVTIGDQAVIYPGVRIYPYKEVEYGAQLHESLIWESRSTARLFGQDGVLGLVNVDLTPEIALRFGAALGTALKRGARVVASRESAPAYQMIKRAIISGLHSTGIQVADLRTLPAPVGKHHLKTQGYDAAFHVGAASHDPEAVQIRLFERKGIALSARLQKEIEKHYTRQELRRVPFSEVGDINYPARARETYAHDLLSSLDATAIKERGFRIIVDYGYSAASYVLPLVLGPLGVEVITAHAFESDSGPSPARLRETIESARRLVPAANADFGAVFDRSAERIYLIDEQGREVRPDQALLLFLQLLGDSGRAGRVVVPINTTSQIEEVTHDRLEVVRTPASLPELTRVASEPGVIFAGAVGGGFIFPDFQPAYDAMASLCKLLELLAVSRSTGTQRGAISEIVAGLPRPTLIHRQVQCPWALKGTVMRVLNERFAAADVDLRDGIKVFDERGWVQVLPDPDEPLVHLYAEGETTAASEELQAEINEIVSGVIEREEIGARS